MLRIWKYNERRNARGIICENAAAMAYVVRINASMRQRKLDEAMGGEYETYMYMAFRPFRSFELYCNEITMSFYQLLI